MTLTPDLWGGKNRGGISRRKMYRANLHMLKHYCTLGRGDALGDACITRRNRDACKSVYPRPPCNLSIVSRLNRPLISCDNRQRRKQLIVRAKRVTCTSGLRIMRGWRTDFIV